MRRKRAAIATTEPGYESVLDDIVRLLEVGRQLSARAVNAALTATYWGIGQRIVEHEQHGRARASYGEELMVRLSSDLTARFGRGFGRANLHQMRGFYLAYQHILQTPSG